MARFAVFWLQVACSGVLAGRAFEHLFRDPPFRSLLWDQSFMEPLLRGFLGVTWEHFATFPEWERLMEGTIHAFGYLYLLGAIATWFVPKGLEWMRFLGLTRFQEYLESKSLLAQVWMRIHLWILPLCSLALLSLGFLMMKSRFLQMPMLLEHAAQISAPILLFLWVLRDHLHGSLVVWARWMIALTFGFHGLYALNWPYPRPGIWVDWTLDILGVSEELAKNLLFTAGVLDWVVALLILLPIHKFGRIVRFALYYCVAWGALTAWARTVAFFDWNDVSAHLWANFWETIVRFPHGFLPLFVLYVVFWSQRACLPKCSKIKNRMTSCLTCPLAYRHLIKS
jgi:hypothetical protein